ncbi:3-hexulose-6-phosphate synthase [Alkalibacillus silvisoli]|uniref:3-hexulose-6-phosphate synthase n=1 Tax=Alkalibacillus silvisoli TaxID=392823 RepID=UPI0031E35B3E
MKLQLALDRLSWTECFDVLHKTESEIDIIEVGTGVIKEYGMSIVREIRKTFPNHRILADMKTCDAGGHEAKQAFEAGADIVTVMAFSSSLTIQDTLTVAQDYSGQVMVDLLEVEEREQLRKLVSLNVELVSLHVGKDQQKEGVFNSSLFNLVDGFLFKVAVAGGINEETIGQVTKGEPDIVIVGGAITKALEPLKVAQKIREYI